MRIQGLRRGTQMAVLALTLTGLFVGTTGAIYPYYFCYSCPWDVGNCPLGLMQHGFIDIQITFWTGMALLLYLFGFLAVMALLMGRAFCGWACPIGLLQDMSRKLGAAGLIRKKLKPAVDPRFKNFKYLILLAVPVTAYLSRDLFFTNLCPVGGVTGTIPTLLFYTRDWSFGSGFAVKVTSMALFFLLIVLVIRGWCKYLCPLGAFLAPWNKVSRVGLKRDENTCTDCSLCEKRCPMDVKEIGKKPDSECILCGRCVSACRFKSLKLGFMPFGTKKLMVMWVALLLASAAILGAGLAMEGYGRADKINSLPCLGCLALDPYKLAEWRVTEEAQPDFVTEHLAAGPVFLHYRTDVCPACDEMEPHIEILEAQYGEEIEFIHINLDHATAEEDASYDLYDFAGTPSARFGVPMFSTIIVETIDGKPEILYNTQYGSSSDQGESKRLELEATILESLRRHSATALPTQPASPSDAVVFSELFVDMGCVNCYRSEHALEDLEALGKTHYVTFITDAPDLSGSYSRYRERHYVEKLGIDVLGHPLAVFAGGPDMFIGAPSRDVAFSRYLGAIDSALLSGTEISISGNMALTQESLHANITVANLEDNYQEIIVEAYLVERHSHWKNVQGQPIPNAFIDLVANRTVAIPAGGSAAIPVEWAGTAAVLPSDLRGGNIGIIVVAWKDGLQITSRMIEPSVSDTLHLLADRSQGAALPNGTVEFSFTLSNYQAAGMEAALTVEKPVNWDADTSVSSLFIAGGGTAMFTLTLTGNGTVTGSIHNFTMRATSMTDATIQATARLQVVVKNDITPPTVGTPASSPEHPRADELITVTVSVTDDSGVDSVKLSYFSCTAETCSPYFIADMNLTADGIYSASIRPIGTDHTDLHYRFIVEDTEGNVLVTGLFDVELEPLEGSSVAARPKWMGVVLLSLFGVIGAAVALHGIWKGRRKSI